MTRISAILLLALLVTLGPPRVYAQQSGYDLFQQALVKERSNGQIHQAIELYRKIVAEYAADRALTARALLQMGRAYERLGSDEALSIYQRLLRDYADQLEPAAEARSRLAAMTGRTAANDDSTIVLRRVSVRTAPPNSAAPSSDGTVLAFVDWDTGDLALRDLATGTERHLTNKGPWSASSEFAVAPAPSHDGKQIAYAWFNDGQVPDVSFDLRVVGVDGSKPRILRRNSEDVYLEPVDWSPDGRRILALVTSADGTNQIAWIRLPDGSKQSIKTLGWHYPENISLSPDGRFVAYDAPARGDSTTYDIFVLSTDGSWERPLVRHPAHDASPVWTPDGKGVLFLSDRRGTMDAWSIPFAESDSQQPAQLVKSNMGRVAPMGVTRDGALYYGVETSSVDVYTATFDPVAGRVTGAAAIVTQRFSGSNQAPTWSPDGKQLAYVAQRRNLPVALQASRVLAIREVETGAERALRPTLRSFQRPQWSPDGRVILVDGEDERNRQGLYTIDAATGAVTPIVRSEPRQYTQHKAWSPDGKVVYFVRGGELFALDREAGRETRLMQNRAWDLAVSPSGEWIAFKSSESGLSLVKSAGGEPRELLRLEPPGFVPGYRGLVWTPDGRAVLFVRMTPESTVGELWWVRVETGRAEPLGLAMENLRNLALHPDGRRLAFAAGQFKSEVWVMEHFLSQLGPSTNEARP